jgi:hypothetical protein
MGPGDDRLRQVMDGYLGSRAAGALESLNFRLFAEISG